MTTGFMASDKSPQIIISIEKHMPWMCVDDGDYNKSRHYNWKNDGGNGKVNTYSILMLVDMWVCVECRIIYTEHLKMSAKKFHIYITIKVSVVETIA